MTEDVGTMRAAPTVPTTRRVFITYARTDRERVQRLGAGLRRLSHEVWIDDRLSVGQKWWDEILRQIRLADVIVVAVSPALLESRASTAERGYAQQLGKPFLPVLVRPVSTRLLPLDLADIHVVDYSEPGPDAAFELANALLQVPASTGLPDPLPTPPPVPFSYMTDLTEKVHGPSLSLDEQMAVVARLRTALGKEADRPAAVELLRSFANREDLYSGTAREVDGLLAQVQPEKSPTSPITSGTGSARPAPKPGWYPDPTRRFGFRWFDNGWTDWASNGVGVTHNPL
jgi:hypothetical protein